MGIIVLGEQKGRLFMHFLLKYSVEWYLVDDMKIRFKEFDDFNKALLYFNDLDSNANITSARLIVTHATIKR